MLAHPLSASTHTVEIDQLTQLNEALHKPGTAPVTVSDLGLVAASGRSRGIPADAVLTRVSFDGPPEYPYIHGRFSTGAAGALTVEMHTPALRELSRRLHLHHAWGV